MRTQLATLLFASLMVSAACGKKKEGDASGGGTAAGKPTTAEPAKLTWKKLGALGLEAEVPEDANVEDNTAGAGFPSSTIYASPTLFVFGAGDMSDLKPTIEDTKKELEKDPNKVKSFTKEEKTADGWVIEADRESMIDQKPLYAISVRRNIDGKPWDCSTNASTQDERAKALKVCQSLRAAK